jgi:bifunctional non-homologous end joining protein LigD
MSVGANGIRVPDPMLATLGPPPLGAGFAVEFKWDGFRGRILAQADKVSVYTRNGAQALSTFPELIHVPAGIGRDVLLDGEIVALDCSGRPSFTRLQQRWPMRRRPAPSLLRETPVKFLAFDLLAIGDNDLTARPYLERRQALDELAATSTSEVLVVPPSWQGVDPSHMLAVAAEQLVEGIVSKRVSSQYISGRSRDWIKTPVRNTCELAIVGWWPSRAAAGRHEIGALLLAGRAPNGELVVAGQVGAGFSSAERRRLHALLVEIPTKRPPVTTESTVHGVQWVKPVLVGEVAFREYIPGRGLRHVSWKGLRNSNIQSIGMPPAAV